MLSKISDAQMRLARKFEAAGLTTISQAVKAFEKSNKGDEFYQEKINDWKRQLSEKQNVGH